MITEKQRERAKFFSNMHKERKMFVLPNAWDAGSAVVFERAGFAAVATSSAGIAYSLGCPDGETITFDELLYVVERMAQRIGIPLSVDAERGYAETPEGVKENAKKLLEAGAIGFNIEDGLPDGTLSPLDFQLDKITALVELKRETGLDFVINARTCAYWLNVAGEEGNFEIALKRGNAFADAGADCVYVPGALSEEIAAKLVRGIKAPLNVILNGAFHDFAKLETLGVRRLSVGSSPARFIYGQAIEMSRALRAGDPSLLLGTKFSYASANEFFA